MVFASRLETSAQRKPPLMCANPPHRFLAVLEFVMFVVPEIIAIAFGWIGALAAVSAYGLVTAQRITAQSAAFQALNAIGAGLLSVSAYANGAIPSALVNIVWVGIGVYALWTIWLARRDRLAAFIEVLPPIHAIAAAAFEAGAELDALLDALYLEGFDAESQEHLVQGELSIAA